MTQIFTVKVYSDLDEGPVNLWLFSSREAAAKYALSLVGKVSLPGIDHLSRPDPKFDLHYAADEIFVDGPYAEGDDVVKSRNRITAEDL